MPGGNKNIGPGDGKLFVKGDERCSRLGRPKKMALEPLLRRVLRKKINDKRAIVSILEKLRDMALDGDLRAAEILLDRTWGKPKTSIETTGRFAVVQIQYIIPDGQNNNVKADLEAAFGERVAEDK